MICTSRLKPNMDFETEGADTKEELLRKLQELDPVWYMNVKANNGPFVEAATLQEGAEKMVAQVNQQFGRYLNITLK